VLSFITFLEARLAPSLGAAGEAGRRGTSGQRPPSPIGVVCSGSDSRTSKLHCDNDAGSVSMRAAMSPWLARLSASCRSCRRRG
jgi:hypothetical protein